MLLRHDHAAVKWDFRGDLLMLIGQIPACAGA